MGLHLIIGCLCSKIGIFTFAKYFFTDKTLFNGAFSWIHLHPFLREDIQFVCVVLLTLQRNNLMLLFVERINYFNIDFNAKTCFAVRVVRNTSTVSERIKLVRFYCNHLTYQKKNKHHLDWWPVIFAFVGLGVEDIQGDPKVPPGFQIAVKPYSL